MSQSPLPHNCQCARAPVAPQCNESRKAEKELAVLSGL